MNGYSCSNKDKVKPTIDPCIKYAIFKRILKLHTIGVQPVTLRLGCSKPVGVDSYLLTIEWGRNNFQIDIAIE